MKPRPLRLRLCRLRKKVAAHFAAIGAAIHGEETIPNMVVSLHYLEGMA